jgi:uncharacterized protein
MIPTHHDKSLEAKLQQALDARGPDYNARTKHLDSQNKPLFTNRLIQEHSPYLLQHAHNPVDWSPWGEEAFARAEKEGKPIFLSIGYSTCHWCHVMEEESFENLQIAEILNEYFVPIKVDREVHPHVDETYMNGVMLMTGRGGWPMSSFLTPDGKTFYGGTYYPPAQFKDLLEQIHKAWQESRPQILAQANQVAEAVAQLSATNEAAETLGKEMIPSTVASILERHDEEWGGFSSAPKFPNEPILFLLLNEAERSPDPTILAPLEHTLTMMSAGGLYDQIGGGFHRYSVDHKWLVPHFEKMLYNQAHLSRAYLRGWQLTGNPAFERTARETFDFVLREMTDDQGGFYSAYDADSEGHEGLYYLWTPAQIRDVLNDVDATLALDLFAVSPGGNFEGQTILTMPQALEDYALKHQLEPNSLAPQVKRIKTLLWEDRQGRIPPLRDDKIVTAWNGMMITAFAQAGDLLNDPVYLQAALDAAEYMWKEHRVGDGSLLRATFEGKASVMAGQEDYAYLAEAYIMLYDVTADRLWLDRAREITDSMLELFWDKVEGGFFMGMNSRIATAMGSVKNGPDGAIPSGNSVALHVLQKLSRRTDHLDYGTTANKLLAAFSSSVQRNPSAFAYLLSGANDLFNGEIGSHQYAGGGAVSAHAVLREDELTLTLSIQPGWHINAHEPLQKELIPTTLALFDSNTVEGSVLKQVEYPPAKMMSLGFQDETMALYEGTITITAHLDGTNDSVFSKRSVPIELSLQACNDTVCREPEVLKFVLYPVGN